MQRLASVLETEALYDDELAELQHHFEALHAKCAAVCRKHRLRPDREEELKTPPQSVDPLGSLTELQKGLASLVRQFTQPPEQTPPLPLLSERIRQEVNEATVPGHSLSAVRERLHAFYKRRRGRLLTQMSLITSRMRRYVRTAKLAQRVGPAVDERLELLQREVEAAESRLRRLKPLPPAQAELPVAKASTGKQLFFANEPYHESTLSCIFKGDVAVCIRELSFEDRTTRGLRRFLRCAQHLPISHRSEIWRRSMDLQPSGEGVFPRLPLTHVAKSDKLERHLEDLALEVGCSGLLRTDEGHAFARAVVADFPVMLEQQLRRMHFPAYPAHPEQGGADENAEDHRPSNLGAGPFRHEDCWLDAVVLLPRVDIFVEEQRALIRGAEEHSSAAASISNASSERAVSPASVLGGPDAELQLELEFLREQDCKAVEHRLCDLARERACAEPDQAPEHLLRSFYLLRHLGGCALRRELLDVLNLFRFAQQKLAHGVLAVQLAGTFPGESQSDVATAATVAPPSLAQGGYHGHPGFLQRSARDALAALSDAEHAGTGSAILDEHGVRIVHEAALSDLEALEQEVLRFGSYMIREEPAELQACIDRAGIVVDLLAAEAKFHQAKWRLLEPYLEAWEHVVEPAVRVQMAQRIVDVMASRPRFDLKAPCLLTAYAAATAALDERAELLRKVLVFQFEMDRAATARLSRHHEVARGLRNWGGASEEDPQLSMTEDLAHDDEGHPFRIGSSGLEVRLLGTASECLPVDLLDVCGSVDLAWQVDLLVEEAAGQLAEQFAPEVSRRHSLEQACALVLHDLWTQELAEGRVGLLTPVAGGMDVLGYEAMDDPAWLMMTVEDRLHRLWQAQSTSSSPTKTPAPGEAEKEAESPVSPRRLTQRGRQSTHFEPPQQPTLADEFPELDGLPYDEVLLSLYCNLLEQVTLRRRLADTMHEARTLEVALTRQAEFVGGAGTTFLHSEPIPELESLLSAFRSLLLTNAGPSASGQRLGTLQACNVEKSFSHVDLSTGAQIMSYCRSGNLAELRHVLQHELAISWLYTSCAHFNTLILDSALRRRGLVDAAAKAAKTAAPHEARATRLLTHLRRASLLSPPVRRAASGRNHEGPVSPAKAELTRLAGLLEFPTQAKAPVWVGVGSAVRESGRFFRKRMEDTTEPEERRRQLMRFRHRFLAYASVSTAELACDLIVRVQAAKAAGDLRAIAAAMPGEVCPFRFSTDEHPRRMINADGSVNDILCLPQPSEVLALRGMAVGSVDVSRSIREQEAQLPNVVDTSTAADESSPQLELNYVGPACTALLLLHELAPIAAFSLFSGGIKGDGLLLLRLLHAAGSARHDVAEAQRAASEVLDIGMLGTVQLEDFRREKDAQTLEQITWDALQSIRMDFMTLASQVSSLKAAQQDPLPVVALLQRKRACATLRAAALFRQAKQAALREGDLDAAAEFSRWCLYVEAGYDVGGGSRVLLADTAVSDLRAPADEREALSSMTLLERPGSVAFPRFGRLVDEEANAGSSSARCQLMHPLAHAVTMLLSATSHVGAGSATATGPGDYPFGPFCGRTPWALPEPPLQALTRALCLLPPCRRERTAELLLRLEMQGDTFLEAKGARIELASSLEDEVELCQAVFTSLNLRTVALCFKLWAPPPQTQEEQLRFDTAFASFAELQLREVVNEEEQSNTQPRSPNSSAQQDSRNAVRKEVDEIYESVGCYRSSINRSIMRSGLKALTQLHAHLESRLKSEGGKAVLRLAERLRSRAILVDTFGEPGSSAWVLKERDVNEIVGETGHRLLQWACKAGDQQHFNTQERSTELAAKVMDAEQELDQARFDRARMDDEFEARLAAAVADRGWRQLFEFDRLHRQVRATAAAAFEMEHRLSVELQTSVLKELGGLDSELVKVNDRFQDYTADMVQGMQEELQSLRQAVLPQLKKLGNSNFVLQQRVKMLSEDPTWGAPETPAAPVELQPPVQIISAEEGLEDPQQQELEQLHAEIHELEWAETRLQTHYWLKYQQLHETFDQDISRLQANLSSNTVLWEQSSEARERQRVMGEEFAALSKRQGVAAATIEQLSAEVAADNSACERLANWKEWAKQVQQRLERELQQYERGGAPDARRMEHELAQVDAELQRLSAAAPANEHAALHQAQVDKKLKALRRQARQEEHLTQKATAKANLIRQDLERGNHDDDESLIKLVHEEYQELARQVAHMEAENARLREGLTTTGGKARVGKARVSHTGVNLASHHEGAPSFEEKLCFSMGFMKSPRHWGFQSQIDQALESRSVSEPPSAKTPSRKLAATFMSPRRTPSESSTPPLAPGPGRGTLAALSAAAGAAAAAAAAAASSSDSLLPRKTSLPAKNTLLRHTRETILMSERPPLPVSGRTPRTSRSGSVSAREVAERKPRLPSVHISAQPGASGTEGGRGPAYHLSPVSSTATLRNA